MKKRKKLTVTVAMSPSGTFATIIPIKKITALSQSYPIGPLKKSCLFFCKHEKKKKAYSNSCDESFGNIRDNNSNQEDNRTKPIISDRTFKKKLFIFL